MVGLFGCVSGTVANLTVTGSINAKVYGGYIAPIAANLAGGKVINCVNRAAITVEGTGTDTLGIMHIGGIAGAVRSGCDTAYIKNSANYGNIAVKAQNVGKGSGDLGDASSVALEGESGSTIYKAPDFLRIGFALSVNQQILLSRGCRFKNLKPFYFAKRILQIVTKFFKVILIF